MQRALIGTSNPKTTLSHKFASVPLIPKFARECAARFCELRNRDTSAHRTIFPRASAAAAVRVAAFALERARFAWRPLPAATAARAAPAAPAPDGYRLAAAVAGLRPPAPRVSALARWSR